VPYRYVAIDEDVVELARKRVHLRLKFERFSVEQLHEVAANPETKPFWAWWVRELANAVDKEGCGTPARLSLEAFDRLTRLRYGT